MIVYGKNVIKEAVLNDRPIYKLYIDKKFNDKKFLYFLKDRNIEYEELAKDQLNELTDNGVHQGVVADVKEYQYYDIEDVITDKDKIYSLIILDGIQDPHNLGAVLRTAEASQMSAVMVSKRDQVPLNATVAKVSSGAIEHVKVIQVSNINNALPKLKKLGFLIVGTDSNANYSYTEIPKDKSVGIILGNEGIGIRPLVRRNCDMLVSIPMLGKVNSLNVSVAGALLMYERVKK